MELRLGRIPNCCPQFLEGRHHWSAAAGRSEVLSTCFHITANAGGRCNCEHRRGERKALEALPAPSLTHHRAPAGSRRCANVAFAKKSPTCGNVERMWGLCRQLGSRIELPILLPSMLPPSLSTGTCAHRLCPPLSPTPMLSAAPPSVGLLPHPRSTPFAWRMRGPGGGVAAWAGARRLGRGLGRGDVDGGGGSMDVGAAKGAAKVDGDAG